MTKASFLYIRDSPEFAQEKPYYFSGPLDKEGEALRTNIILDAAARVPVRDIRLYLDLLDLDAWFLNSQSQELTYTRIRKSRYTSKVPG
jgi:hypothetical protein